MTGTPEPASCETVDVAGVGVGPFNLSLAALLHGAADLSARFFEARPGFAWHPGLLFDFATLQSPYLKDLVTLVDPTNPFSFLNYLVREHRIHRFIVSDYVNVPRQEYNRYFQWVCGRLASLRFSARVERLSFDGSSFVLEGDGFGCRARHVVLGVGHSWNVPPEAEPHLGPTVLHGAEYLVRQVPREGRRIVVIGGGQTGAEIFYDLISERRERPAHVTWVTRRHNFVPFDESPFANELYVPGYTKAFFHYSPEHRRALLEKQKYSSDAIVQPLLLDIYRTLYEMDHLHADRRIPYRLMVDRRLAALEPEAGGWVVVTDGPDARERTPADVVVLATGFRFQVPALLAPLADRVPLDAEGGFVVNEDFSIAWDGPPEHRIYVHNGALRTHGWVDPNFAGMAWRSAVMVNSLAGREVYDLSGTDTAVDWVGDRVGAPESDGARLARRR